MENIKRYRKKYFDVMIAGSRQFMPSNDRRIWMISLLDLICSGNAFCDVNFMANILKFIPGYAFEK